MEAPLGSILWVKRGRIRPFADQPREYFDQAELNNLARSIKAVGQQVEVIIRPLAGDPAHDYELVDGQRRWIACGMVGKDRMKAIVREDVQDPEDQFLASVISNFCREGHSVLETAKAIRRVMKRPEIKELPKWEQYRQVGEYFGRSNVWVYQHHSILNLAPEVQKMMSPEIEEGRRITLQTANLLATLPKEVQVEMAVAVTTQRLNFKRTQLLVRQMAREKDLVPGKRTSFSPSNTRDRFFGAIGRISDEAEVLMDMGIHDFDRMFDGRPRKEVEGALTRMDRCVEQLEMLAQSIRRRLVKTPASNAA